MTKLLSVSALAVSAMFAVPAVAQTVQGGHLYIQDTSAPVEITYIPSNSTHTNYLYIGTLDSNGNYVDSWDLLLKSVGTPDDKASIGSCYSCLMTTNTYTFTPGEDAVELVFFWSNENMGMSFYSDAVNRGRNPVDASKNLWDLVTYNPSGGATLGLEDGGGGRRLGGTVMTDWDWNDVVISMTNVGSTIPPTIPEPETYVMLLAGLGMVGAIVRRRRNMSR